MGNADVALQAHARERIVNWRAPEAEMMTIAVIQTTDTVVHKLQAGECPCHRVRRFESQLLASQPLDMPSIKLLPQQHFVLAAPYFHDRVAEQLRIGKLHPHVFEL